MELLGDYYARSPGIAKDERFGKQVKGRRKKLKK
jgi:hypothetical protein